MVMQPTFGNSVVENQTIEISQESLRTILNQIEAELVDSEVYRRTMAGLQTMLGEASSTAQILVKAVGREAVRLTFQQVARQYKVVPVPSEQTNQATDQHSNAINRDDYQPMQDKPSLEATPAEDITVPMPTLKSPSLLNRPIGETKPPKKLTKAQLTAQKAAQEREELLRQVGQQLRQAREARSLSIRQLYSQTLVPPHHIEAIEAGKIDQLPEDVYIRGFIRRIAHALGLDATAISASIPEPDLTKSVVPSWYDSLSVSGFQINSMHLYLGYTALIAGAIGGLGMMSKQATPGVSVEPEPMPSPQSSVSHKAEAESTNKPGIQTGKAGVKAGADIAPPETLSN